MSIPEAQKAVRNVSNRVFGRHFKIVEDHDNEEESSIEVDTLPKERFIRKMDEKVQTHGMAAEAQEIVDRKFEGGNVFTHASDSTTKKGVGKFNVAALHINRDEVLPLPTIPVAEESKDEIAEYADMGFHLLTVASGKTIEELYKVMDLHLTDSVSHNKFLSKEIQKLMDLDHKTGHICCTTLTNYPYKLPLQITLIF